MFIQEFIIIPFTILLTKGDQIRLLHLVFTVVSCLWLIGKILKQKE
jgi:hypothetical protein